jgi:hypothetical protein
MKNWLRRRRWLAAMGSIGVASVTQVTGCNPAAEKSAAEGLCGRLFVLIQSKDYEAAADLYDARFYQMMPRAEWIVLLGTVAQKLGDLQKYELVTWNMRQVAGAGDAPASGTYGDLQYKTIYARFEAAEALTVFRPAAGDGPYRVVGHKINSEGFLKG